jgi:protein SCO1/2
VSHRTLQLAAPLIVIVAIVVAATALLSSGHSKPKLPGGVKRTSAAQGYRGGVVSPVKAAPSISLENYLGQHVTLSQYRGKVVLVTFLYTHCPDVCPLIASSLKTTEAKLGPAASKVQAIAVSVDPRGDTRKSVADFLKARGMTGKMQYLLGSAGQLGRVWSAERRVAAGCIQPRAGRALRACLRDHCEREAQDGLRRQLQSGRNRPRRSAARSELARCKGVPVGSSLSSLLSRRRS